MTRTGLVGRYQHDRRDSAYPYPISLPFTSKGQSPRPDQRPCLKSDGGTVRKCFECTTFLFQRKESHLCRRVTMVSPLPCLHRRLVSPITTSARVLATYTGGKARPTECFNWPGQVSADYPSKSNPRRPYHQQSARPWKMQWWFIKLVPGVLMNKNPPRVFTLTTVVQCTDNCIWLHSFR